MKRTDWPGLALHLEAAGASLTPYGKRLAQLRTECAWCGKVIRDGVLPVSHGRCEVACPEAIAMGMGDE